MCHGRLAAGEAPACVQACPSGAISIQIVAKADIERISAAPGEQMLPGAFESSYTQTDNCIHFVQTDSCKCSRRQRRARPLGTRSLAARVDAGAYAGWSRVVSIECADVGLQTENFCDQQNRTRGSRSCLSERGSDRQRFSSRPTTRSLARVFRISSLLDEPRDSRLCPFHALSRSDPAVSNRDPGNHKRFARTCIVFCSAMIYVDTRRPSWASSLTFPRFFGSTFLLGSSAAASVLSFMTSPGDAEFFSTAHIAGVGNGNLYDPFLLGKQNPPALREPILVRQALQLI